MVSRNRTPTDAGALAAGLLVESCWTTSDDALRLGVVRDLALDLERKLYALSGSAENSQAPDSLIEAALACADLATLAACNLSEILEDGKPLAVAAVHLTAGAVRSLVVLLEAWARTLDEDHAENTLRDARSARWRTDLAVRQIEEPRKDQAPG